MWSAEDSWLQRTEWWRLVCLSSCLLSRAAQREEKLVKTLIVAIKGYWLSFPPCLGDKVSISWSYRELLKTCVLRGCPVLWAARCWDHTGTHTHAKLTHCYSFTYCHQIIHFTARDQTLSPLAVCCSGYCNTHRHIDIRLSLHTVLSSDKAWPGMLLASCSSWWVVF